MKKILIFLLAMVVFSCHNKKKDDPAPTQTTSAVSQPKTVTLYITKNGYYPTSTDYFDMGSFMYCSNNIWCSQLYSVDSTAKKPMQFLNLQDSISSIGFSIKGFPNSGYGVDIQKGTTNQKLYYITDTMYIHMVCQ